MMPEQPLLILGQATQADRDPGRQSRGKGIHLPGGARQGVRIAPKLQALQDSLAARSLRLQAGAGGADVEQVVVFETVGSIENFLTAVRKVDGLEWLAEFAEPEVPPDDDFGYTKASDAAKPLEGTMYLVMENAQGMQQLLSLWQRYQQDETAPFDRGLAPIKNLFKQLRDLRRWDVTDRVRETGIAQNWREQIELGNDIIRFEADLWFRESGTTRASAYAAFSAAVAQAGGQCITQSTIPEIRYHGVLVELPHAPVQEVLGRLDDLLQLPETNFVRAEEVMFFRPTPQCSIPLDLDAQAAPPDVPAIPQPAAAEQPIVALLDGLPLGNHRRLAGRLVIDDPDAWEQNYLAEHRQHGTAMASLILYGDLNANDAPLSRPIYVRPVLRAIERNGRWREETPENVLPIDMTYRIFRRMFEGEGNLPPSAPTVRIVNFSIGDSSRPFIHELSPWARLFDWAAWRYNLLINVSSGNHATLSVPVLMQQFNGLTPAQRAEHVFRHILENSRHRRLLSPGESLNCICVGATHEDQSPPVNVGAYRVDACPNGLPSPLNALGFGYRRAIKPDILLPGGRQFFSPMVRHGKLELDVPPSRSAPGQLVAMPAVGGATNAEGYVRGSSNATALASRGAAQLYDVLSDLRGEAGIAAIPERFTAVLLKALLVHGAAWPDSWDQLRSVLPADATDEDFRKLQTQIGGYGRLEIERVLACTAQRATMLGAGTLQPELGHIYRVPLPTCFNATTEYRRLTVTLAWMTPLNHRHRKYRGTILWFDPPTAPLQVRRTAGDSNAVRRGTVQHEILEGTRAIGIADGEVLEIKVNCRKDAGGDGEMGVNYALAVTLEAAATSILPVYQQIRQRLQPAVEIAPAP